MSVAKKITTDYYRETFKKYGDTPEGVDWNDLFTQNLRFKQIVDELKSVKSFTVLDVGCGTGALFGFMRDELKGYNFQYTGIDYVAEMTDEASKKYSNFKNAKFQNTDLDSITEKYDFVVSSGIFNVKLSVDSEKWFENMKCTLKAMFEHCTKGIIFNVLTKYVDFTDDKLYYSDPLLVFEYFQENCSRFIKLNHSYPLYEYTISGYREDFIRSIGK